MCFVKSGGLCLVVAKLDFFCLCTACLFGYVNRKVISFRTTQR